MEYSYYADLSENGNITGFYRDDFPVPATAVKLTYAQWEKFIFETFKYRYSFETKQFRYKTDQEIIDDTPISPPVPLTPEQQRINDLEMAISMLLAGGGE